MPDDERSDFLVRHRNAVARAGFDPDYYFIEDRASDCPYYNYYAAERAEPKLIFTLRADMPIQKIERSVK